MKKEPVTYVLKATIAKDQRDYIEQVRLWLHDGLKGKGKIVGGPVNSLGLEQMAE